MDGWLDEWVDGWMVGWMSGWMDGQKGTGQKSKKDYLTEAVFFGYLYFLTTFTFLFLTTLFILNSLSS